jgi:hypothetical protein
VQVSPAPAQAHSPALRHRLAVRLAPARIHPWPLLQRYPRCLRWTSQQPLPQPPLPARLTVLRVRRRLAAQLLVRFRRVLRPPRTPLRLHRLVRPLATPVAAARLRLLAQQRVLPRAVRLLLRTPLRRQARLLRPAAQARRPRLRQLLPVARRLSQPRRLAHRRLQALQPRLAQLQLGVSDRIQLARAARCWRQPPGCTTTTRPRRLVPLVVTC